MTRIYHAPRRRRSKRRKIGRASYGGSSRKCYLINNDTGDRLLAQYNPTEVPYGRSANYTSIESPGMSYPLTQYTGGNIREFTIELFFYDNPYSGVIEEAREFLEELLPPERNSGTFVPPTFTFAYGYFVKDLVLVQLDVNDAWLDRRGRPIQTTFNLTVRQVGG